ncbi:MAG: heparan-alpha-glucosaminide N-acetyltransferase domain-containing protein [Bacteroidota bacterium]|nr:heparan-alpha-glucosaminide N-acetyltransferase domain-containing protein [Bacteroidota bacterium]
MNSLKAMPLKTSYRIESIDILRGMVMLIMAIDHTREFFHHDSLISINPLDLKATSPIVFFTRWITHFCAPVFVFLSGASIFLYGQKRTKNEVAFFLFTRGIWLMLAEIFIVNFFWEFNYGSFLMLEVIWTIGLSMVILSLLQFLPYKFLLALGLLIIAGHNLLDNIKIDQPAAASFLWSLVHVQKVFFPTPHFIVLVAYPFLPWLGLMIVGYCLGKLYTKTSPVRDRKKFLLSTGVMVICLFILLRFINIYGDPSRWAHQKSGLFTFLDFINTTKYPPSLLFVLMTIGPALIVLSVTENISNWFSRFVIVYGKVPFFYFLLHVLLIHAISWVFYLVSGYGSGNINFPGTVGFPTAVGYPLWVVYLVWLSVILILYYPCKWYGTYKASHPEKKWLTYL